MLLAGEACAERAMWLWGASKAIVLDTAGTAARKDFFDFCAAPKGDAAKAVTTVFFDAKPYGYNLMTLKAAELRQFLTEAHARGLKIEFLSGSKTWATPEGRTEAETLTDEVLSFNLGGAVAQRFDGIHYDIEPYLLDAKDAGDSLDWNYDQAYAWETYLSVLSACKVKVNNYNSIPFNTAIRFGVDIPYWYVYGSVPGPQQVIDRVDYIAIMDYKDTAANIISGAQDEIIYAAAAGKKVYIGVETAHPVDNTGFPPASTFYEEGNAQMEFALTQVDNNFSGNSGYAGIALHHYEDLSSPRQYESAYRRLWTGSYLGHVPQVFVVSPKRTGETWAGTVNIQWDASDLDGNSLTITLQYSANGGITWTNIATGLSNTGSYAWNTTGRPAGSNYMVKVIATDNSPNLLVGYGASSVFSISGSVTATDITDLQAWVEDNSSIRLKWTPPAFTPRYYRIYRSVNGAAFPATPTVDNVVAVNKYIDSGLTGTDKYKYKIRAVYGNGQVGNLSNTSNMLKPGSTFLIDSCEQIEEMTYNIYGASALSSAFDTSVIKEGSKSLSLTYTYAGSGWGAVFVGTFPVKVDISPYVSASMWVKEGPLNGTAIALQIKETGRSEGNETWQSPALFISSIDWTEYAFNLSSFTRADVEGGSGNNRLDTHSIGGYALMFSPGTPNSVYYIDDIKLTKQDASLSIPQGTYTFGVLSGSLSDHRFRIGPIPVSFGGYDMPWTVRIWTNNGSGAEQSGLKGADSSTYIPLRVWCANYGPTESVPDEENDDNWANYWFRIVENDEMNPANVYTWRRLCWANGGQDASLASPFDIYLAVDVSGKKNQQYQTTSLTIEYVNE